MNALTVRVRVDSDPLGKNIRDQLEAAGVIVDDEHEAAGRSIPAQIITASQLDSSLVDPREAHRTIAVVGLDVPAREQIELRRTGIADVVVWSEASHAIERILARLARWRQIDERLTEPAVDRLVVGDSPPWRRCLELVGEHAMFSDKPILITGESGTGKEILARLLHYFDPRQPSGELVLVDCSTVVPTLSGSEFFGHTAGAFTGATKPRQGAFELADRGTLFLDEIGELPLDLQAELLRAIQEGAYKPVGSSTWKQTNFRLACATNRDLLTAVAEGRFRADLYHRISAATAHTPALADRLEDIPALARHFATAFAATDDPPPFDAALLSLMLRRQWPGNVRELGNLVSRLCTRHVGPGPFLVGDLSDEDLGTSETDVLEDVGAMLARTATFAIRSRWTLQEFRNRAVTELVQAALDQCTGSTSVAADLLGVSSRTIQLRRPSDGSDR